MRFYGDDLPELPEAPPPVVTLPLEDYLTTMVLLKEAFEEIRRLDALYQSVKP